MSELFAIRINYPDKTEWFHRFHDDLDIMMSCPDIGTFYPIREIAERTIAWITEDRDNHKSYYSKCDGVMAEYADDYNYEVELVQLM